MFLAQPLSMRCGPYWFLYVHLSHSLSLGAGQTVVSGQRGSVATMVINCPKLCNVVNQETAKCLLEEL